MSYSPLEYLISVLAPLECTICKYEGNMLCLECAEKTYPEKISRCYLCNKITDQQRVCTSCRSRSRLRRVWWLGGYSGITKKLIYEMKFGRNRQFAREFGSFLSAQIAYLPENTIVISAPTASSRIRQRGFDQAALMARQFAKVKKLYYAPLLYRKAQVDQIGKGRSQRYKQMQSALGLTRSDKLNGSSVLLIDDVLTSGATLESAARLLREAGVRHVDAAVIARHQI